MDKFLSYLSTKEEFVQIDNSLSEKRTPILLNGISQASLPFVLNYISKRYKEKVVYITPSEISAQDIYKELKKYKDEKVLILQSDELKFYQIDAINRENEFQRIKALKKIYQKDYDILIITSNSLMRKYMPIKYYEDSIIDISISSKFDIYQLSEKLIKIGYERVRKIESKGQFSLRGSILDIFPPDFNNPIRIEFFDDEVDSIRIFDLYTQISIQKIENTKIINAREYIYPDNIDDISKK